ncbi:MAG: glycosyl hydrolase [Planctomycetota bacterium]
MHQSRPLLLALAGLAAAAATPTASSQTVNFAKHQIATANAFADTDSPPYLTDGKIGPANRWVSRPGGRNRANVFFGEEVTLGSLHLYSFGYDGPPIAGFTVNYVNASGQTVPVPGGSVAGNTDPAINVIFTAPVTTSQLQIVVNDDTARIDEIAAFPPNAGAGFPLGTDVDLHLARQHRVASVTASSTAAGATRRAAVDGYVNDTSIWRSGPTGPHTLILDITDPPETSSPVSIRTETTPVVVGGVHIYTGLADGTGIIEAGRLQVFDDRSNAWTDIPGSAFTGNTSGFIDLDFTSPIETATFRLVASQFTEVVVREIVPLPVEVGPAAEWPEGTSVTMTDVPDYRTLGDEYYTLVAGGSSLPLTSGEAGLVSKLPEPTLYKQRLRQQYQILLDVGTDTYRIRNRVSGLCLAVEAASTAEAAPVIEAEYHGMPHQRWRIANDQAGAFQFVNAYTGLAIAATSADAGAQLVQETARADRPLQWWTTTEADHFPKKGVGGFPLRADEFGVNWAYNWGKDGGDFPAKVDYWPMQWGSFFWDAWPELVPTWKRDGDPFMLMGYNEPDAESQSNVPVASALAMWPRNEATNTPLLGPAPVNSPNDWIDDFNAGADAAELRFEYSAFHAYPDNADAQGFINRLVNTYNAYGREVIVTEFSINDWDNSGNFNNDEAYNFFLEVFWRMENLDFLRRWAIFVWTDDPANPFSDNRGEVLNLDGSLTPVGELFAAWDGETTIRTDTPYYLHNRGWFSRIANVPAQAGTTALTLGDWLDTSEDFEWMLEPTGQNNDVVIRSVLDGRLLAANGTALELVNPETTGAGVTFSYTESQHGWFHIDHPATNQRLRINANALELSSIGNSGDWTQWRFAPVYQGEPGAPRGVQAADLGGGEVQISWDEHGFRDIESFAVYRSDMGGPMVLIDADVLEFSFTDIVPSPGTYSYEVVAIGDTGSSPAGVAPAVPVETCQADYNGDFIVNAQDTTDLVSAVEAGTDYNGDGNANFVDVIDFLRVFDAGCSE